MNRYFVIADREIILFLKYLTQNESIFNVKCLISLIKYVGVPIMDIYTHHFLA